MALHRHNTHVGSKIKKLLKEGKPRDQAIAIALNRSKKGKKGFSGRVVNMALKKVRS